MPRVRASDQGAKNSTKTPTSLPTISSKFSGVRIFTFVALKDTHRNKVSQRHQHNTHSAHSRAHVLIGVVGERCVCCHVSTVPPRPSAHSAEFGSRTLLTWQRRPVQRAALRRGGGEPWLGSAGGMKERATWNCARSQRTACALELLLPGNLAAMARRHQPLDLTNGESYFDCSYSLQMLIQFALAFRAQQVCSLKSIATGHAI